MAVSPGVVVNDRYSIDELIATGGMGQVWRATDTVLGRQVAVKILKGEYSADPEFLDRFRHEARTTASLNHPGIAQIYDYGETDDPAGGDRLAYLVMELVIGEPLNKALARLGTLPAELALDMLGQTARALAVAHQAGLVHRDVKPGNILITPKGDVRITDFGIAKAVDAAPVTKTGMVMGTAQYISPEQALGDEATAASDVYSLGVVGFEALTGRRPFGADGASSVTVAMAHVNQKPPALPDSLAPELRDLIGIALRKDPARRYADGDEFARAISRVASGYPAPDPASSDEAPTQAHRDLGPGVAGAAGAAALGGYGAGAADATGAHSAASGPNTTQRPRPPRTTPHPNTGPSTSPFASPNATRALHHPPGATGPQSLPTGASPRAQGGTPVRSGDWGSTEVSSSSVTKLVASLVVVLLIVAAALAVYLFTQDNGSGSTTKTPTSTSRSTTTTTAPESTYYEQPTETTTQEQTEQPTETTPQQPTETTTQAPSEAPPNSDNNGTDNGGSGGGTQPTSAPGPGQSAPGPGQSAPAPNSPTATQPELPSGTSSSNGTSGTSNTPDTPGTPRAAGTMDGDNS